MAELDMGERNAGRLCLALAITGLLVEVLMCACARVFFSSFGEPPSPAFFFTWLGIIVFVESFALIFGIFARRTDAGISGLFLACAVLALLFCLLSATVRAVIE